MTTKQYKTNLRCNACVAAMTPLFDHEPGIVRWSADISTAEKILTIESEGVTRERIDELLKQKGYQVNEELVPKLQMAQVETTTPGTYYPLILILLYLLSSVALVEVAVGTFDGMRAMRHFMAGFFLVFSFFKLLDVPSFAMSYNSYDIVARRWYGYGYLYPFLELALGAAYLANVQPVFVNYATLLVMGVSTIGVVQSLLAKRTIRCACLGTVFNLPMSYVTLVEDLLMIGMAAVMLILTR